MRNISVALAALCSLASACSMHVPDSDAGTVRMQANPDYRNEGLYQNGLDQRVGSAVITNLGLFDRFITRIDYKLEPASIIPYLQNVRFKIDGAEAPMVITIGGAENMVYPFAYAFAAGTTRLLEVIADLDREAPTGVKVRATITGFRFAERDWNNRVSVYELELQKIPLKLQEQEVKPDRLILIPRDDVSELTDPELK